MTENPPPPPGTPEGGGSPPPPPQNPYGSQSPPPPQNPYGSAPPPSNDPYAANPPNAGQSPYGSTPYPASPYPEGPSGTPSVAGARPAGLGIRLGARLIDGLLIAVVDVIITIITGNNRVLTGVIGGLVYLGYYTYMESNRGHTFGKQWLKMRVLGPAGGNPTMEEALRRNAWAALAIFNGIFLIGALTGLAEFIAVIAIAVTISQDNVARRGWHDKFGNTRVIKES